jgi:hypothetical protein
VLVLQSDKISISLMNTKIHFVKFFHKPRQWFQKNLLYDCLLSVWTAQVFLAKIEVRAVIQVFLFAKLWTLHLERASFSNLHNNALRT